MMSLTRPGHAIVRTTAAAGRMLMRHHNGHELELLLLRRIAAPAIAGLLLFLGVAACGGDGDDEPDVRGASATVPCIDEDPGEAATYANEAVAIGQDPRTLEGAELESNRSGDKLPWFAKTAPFVRGTEQVVVRVPSELSGAVRIVGWTQPASSKTSEAVLVQSTSDCPEDWTHTQAASPSEAASASA